MLTPPGGLSAEMLESALITHWAVTAADIRYLALGFGSHHWEITGADGCRWFATADELAMKRWTRAEPLDSVRARLRASLAVAADLAGLGLQFVVAPVPAAGGEPLIGLGRDFSLVLYPFLAGQSFEWGPFSSEAHRRAVLDLVVAVHTAPAAASRRAMADDLSIQFRDELDAGLGDAGFAPANGPYAKAAGELIATSARLIRRLLDRYDNLAAHVRAAPDAMVVTHGEPHPGNTMLACDGWLLIDWDTALVAPPERDLCNLDPGDGSVLAAYEAATGVTPRQAVLDLYRLRWDLTDIAIAVSTFRAPHGDDADNRQTFDLLARLLARLASRPRSWPGMS
ncbi:MAG TPA: aminoglycoside phosphotransferase family protein [Streptosporangiaceae bacterium]|nr:aminoglycoside phosphotransferase family protein [Streptosporangiaceae bacterium]